MAPLCAAALVGTLPRLASVTLVVRDTKWLAIGSDSKARKTLNRQPSRLLGQCVIVERSARCSRRRLGCAPCRPSHDGFEVALHGTDGRLMLLRRAWRAEAGRPRLPRPVTPCDVPAHAARFEGQNSGLYSGLGMGEGQH